MHALDAYLESAFCKGAVQSSGLYILNLVAIKSRNDEVATIFVSSQPFGFLKSGFTCHIMN